MRILADSTATPRRTSLNHVDTPDEFTEDRGLCVWTWPPRV